MPASLTAGSVSSAIRRGQGSGIYQSLRACRAIAAILLVCFHLSATLALDKYFGSAAEGLREVFALGGPARVAFFFVLSGFIITLVHRKDFGEPGRLLRFLRKRAVRIYPVYLLIFSGVYLMALAVPSLRESMPSDPIVLIKSMLLVPQDPAVVGGTGAPVLVVAWSLQFEMVFYAAVALAIVHRMLFAGAVLLFLLNMGWELLAGNGAFPGSFFANELMLLFAFGAASAWVIWRGWRMRNPMAVAVAAGAIFLGLGVAAEVVDTLPEALVNLGFGLAASVLIVALVQVEQVKPQLFGNRLLGLIGDASYAMFLIHFPLIAVLCKLAVAAGLAGAGGMVVAFVGIFIACIATSVAFHLWIERPMLRALAIPARPAALPGPPSPA